MNEWVRYYVICFEFLMPCYVVLGLFPTDDKDVTTLMFSNDSEICLHLKFDMIKLVERWIHISSVVILESSLN